MSGENAGEADSAEGGNAGGVLARALDWIERVGNKLPDPALLFFALLIIVWLLSALMSQFTYEHVDPRSGEANRRAGFGDVNVAEHRIRGGNAAGRRVGQDDNVGQLFFA